jgi:hypothetical protein
MADYLTRHAPGFSVTEGRLDPALCPYVDGFPHYPSKRAVLADLVGTDQFLWAVEKAMGFMHYEQIKLVEWEVKVPSDRLLGFIDENRWSLFFSGTLPTLGNCFTRIRPHAQRFSVLLPFPLYPHECVKRTVFRWLDPKHAEIVDEQTF